MSSYMEREAERKAKTNITILLYLSVILIIILICLLQPYYEAKTFNKFKSKNQPEATYLDAVFANLRVEGN